MAAAKESLHRSRNGRRAADQRRLVAAVAARDDRIAELVLGQAFAALAAERVRRTPEGRMSVDYYRNDYEGAVFW